MKKAGLALCALYLLVYIVPLGVRPLVAVDETRYAEIAREMNESGDYVVPRLNGLRYFEKPPLGHWLNAASMRVFGETNFAVRLASALSVAMMAWAVYLLVRRFGGGRDRALIWTDRVKLIG